LSLNLLIETQFTVTVIETKKLWRKKVLFRVTRLRKVNLLVGYGKGLKIKKKKPKRRNELNSRFEVRST